MFNISLLMDFTNGSIIISVIVRTVYLLRKHIKYSLMTEEEEEESERELQELEDDLDNQTWQLDVVFPGIRNWVFGLLDWVEEHKYLKNVVGYIFCFVPIINLVITLFNLKLIFRE